MAKRRPSNKALDQWDAPEACIRKKARTLSEGGSVVDELDGEHSGSRSSELGKSAKREARFRRRAPCSRCVWDALAAGEITRRSRARVGAAGNGGSRQERARELMLRVCPATSFQTADPDGTRRVQWNGNPAELMLDQRFPC